MSIRRRSLAVGAALVMGIGIIPAGVAQAENETAATSVCQPTALALPAGALGATVYEGVDNLYVGTARMPGDNRAHGVLWENGVPRSLGAAFEQNTHLADVNSSGVAVGGVGGFEGGRAIRYRDGAFEKLPEVPGAAYTYAQAINSSGDIVGIAGLDVMTAVVWLANQPGTVRQLSLPAGEHAYTVDMDDAGNIVALGSRGSYVWTAYGLRFKLAQLSNDGVMPEGIESGLITGATGGRAVVWNTTGQIVRTLENSRHGVDINTSQKVVGQIPSQVRSEYGVWDREKLIGVLGSPLSDFAAYAITANGTIVGRYGPSATATPAEWKC